jgi:hypothetical protein
VSVGDSVVVRLSDPTIGMIANAAVRCAGAVPATHGDCSLLITDHEVSVDDVQARVVVDVRSHLWIAELLAVGNGECMCGEHG